MAIIVFAEGHLTFALLVLERMYEVRKSDQKRFQIYQICGTHVWLIQLHYLVKFQAY